MQKTNFLSPAHLILYFFLLIGGFLTAFIIWIIVIMPLQIVQPVEFQPLKIDKATQNRAENKVRMFLDNEKTLILTREEVGSILVGSIEEKLGLKVTDIYLDFTDANLVTAIFKVEIRDIPRSSFFLLLFRLKNTEYTTTLINAYVRASNGGIGYMVNDFRIGGFKIPDLIVKRLFRSGYRKLNDIKLIEIRFENNTVILTRV